MTTTEHLAKIRAKCAELLAEHENNAAGYVTQKHAVAGWKSTIAAIDGFSYLAQYSSESDECGCYKYAQEQLAAITSAWPEELL